MNGKKRQYWKIGGAIGGVIGLILPILGDLCIPATKTGIISDAVCDAVFPSFFKVVEMWSNIFDYFSFDIDLSVGTIVVYVSYIVAFASVGSFLLYLLSGELKRDTFSQNDDTDLSGKHENE